MGAFSGRREQVLPLGLFSARTAILFAVFIGVSGIFSGYTLVTESGTQLESAESELEDHVPGTPLVFDARAFYQDYETKCLQSIAVVDFLRTRGKEMYNVLPSDVVSAAAASASVLSPGASRRDARLAAAASAASADAGGPVPLEIAQLEKIRKTREASFVNNGLENNGIGAVAADLPCVQRHETGLARQSGVSPRLPGDLRAALDSAARCCVAKKLAESIDQFSPAARESPKRHKSEVKPENVVIPDDTPFDIKTFFLQLEKSQTSTLEQFLEISKARDIEKEATISTLESTARATLQAVDGLTSKISGLESRITALETREVPEPASLVLFERIEALEATIQEFTVPRPRPRRLLFAQCVCSTVQ